MLDIWIAAYADQVQYILFFTLLVVFGIVEVVAPKRVLSTRRKERWTTNFLLTALNVVVLALLPVTFVGVAVWARENGLGLFNQFTLPVALIVLVNLVARGFISFGTHYTLHKLPLFWRVHRVHHLDTELDISTTVRFHPLEFLLNLLMGVQVVVIFGLSPWVLLVYELLDVVVNLFSHSNLRVPRAVNRILCYIIVTPDLHRVHHSSYWRETESNFSAVFPVWDLIFGTFRRDTRAPQENMELGLKGVRDGRANRLWWLLRSPFLNSVGRDSTPAT